MNTMSERLGRHLRSNVVGYVALFAALTLAPAFAATDKAPKNSVVSKSIKDGKVKSVDIGDDQVTGTDVDESTLTGVPLAPCPSGQLLKSSGSGYACATDLDSGGDITSVFAGDGLSGGGASGGVGVALDACADGQVLRSDGTDYACADNGKRVFFDTGATPSVAGGVTLLVLNYTSPEVVTNLADGHQGQIVTIIHGGTNVDINDGANFVLSANWNPDDLDTLTLVKSAGNWVEVARSAN